MVSLAKKWAVNLAFGLSLTLIAYLLIVVQLGKRENFTCNLVDSAPSSNLARLRNIPDASMKSMVNFAGYLIYDTKHLPPEQESPNTILPLKLDELEYEPDKWLLFVTKCARFKLFLNHDPAAQQFTSDRIDVEVRRDSKTSGWLPLCSIRPNNIEFRSFRHYSCNRTFKYPCIQMRKDARGNDYAETIAWLVADKLEIEVGGREYFYEQGKFYYREEPCGN